MDEIKIYTNGGSINCDLETVKEELKHEIELYSKTVFTEETKVQAKNTVANLRKQKKAFEDEIRHAKNIWMKPFEEFQQKAFEVVDMFDEPINYINGQVSVFEEKRIHEKRKAIELIYRDIIDTEQFEFWIPLSKIYNPKWENATYSEKNIREDIFNVKQKVKDGINTLKLMNSEAEEEAINIFLNGYDITRAILHITTYENTKREIMRKEEERIRKETEERIRREEREKIQAEQKKEEEIKVAKEEAKAEVIESLIPEQTSEPSVIYTYRLNMTPSAKEKFEMYLDSIGLDYEVI